MKNTFKSLCALFLALIMTVSVASTAAFAAKAKLSKTAVTIVKGYTYTLKVSNTSSDVKWSSSDSKVVSVSSSGKVTAKSAGKAYIYAKVGSSKLRCRVTVVNASISVSKSSVSLEKGSSATITLTAKGDRSIAVSNPNKSAVSVKSGKWDGNSIKIKITGNKSGTAKIKFYSKKYPNICKYVNVTVRNSSASDKKEETDENGKTDETEEMSYAEQVLYYCNIEREKAGLSKLTLDDTLCKAADIRAGELTESFSHTRPDGRSCFSVIDMDYSYSALGENIAWGYGSAESVVEGWMNSPGHRANILSENFGRLGVGKNGTYWVQIFSD